MSARRTVTYFKIFLILAIASWFALFVAGAGILVKSEEVKDGQLVPKLVCTYFTGLKFVDKEHILTNINLIGKQNCPRFIEF